MSTSRSRQFFSLALLVGAVAFGMVLASGLDQTPPAAAQMGAAVGPVTVANVGAVASGIPSFADLAEAVDPAVVSVISDHVERGRSQSDPFRFFFDQRQNPRQQPDPRNPERQREQLRRSGGTGFVISADGLIVTNNHVIEDADAITVQLDGEEYEATLRGVDPGTDLALLKIDVDRRLPYLALGDSEAVRPGDWVMAIGDPFGLEKTVTVGVVSAKGRNVPNVGDRSLVDFIQTDAAINFGNSGGPLLNLEGEVIGINTAINAGAENIGFAVPADTLRNVLPQLREKGRVSRGYLGITVQEVDRDFAAAFGLDEAVGVLVQDVTADSPSEAAGLEAGDIILQVDGRKVDTTRSLIDYVSSQEPGAKVDLEVWREEKKIAKTVKLTERPGEQVAAIQPEQEDESSLEWIGLSYRGITPELRSNHGMPEDLEGIWVTDVDVTSPLYNEGVRPGQVIRRVNRTTVTTVEEFNQAVEGIESGSYLRLYVEAYTPQGGRAGAYFAVVQKP